MLFAMAGTLWTCHHYAHALKTSLWLMPSTLRKEDTRTRHIEICFSFPNFWSAVCHDVEIEPHLQPLQRETIALKSTTTDDERLNIKDNELWESRFNKTYFDLKIFNQQLNNCPESSSEAYMYQESIKMSTYEQRITEVEKATFCSGCLCMHCWSWPISFKSAETNFQPIFTQWKANFHQVLGRVIS